MSLPLGGILVVSMEQAVAGPFCSNRLKLAGARGIKIERKFRETRLYQTAPVSRNLILSYIAEHVLNLPRSF